jgi:nucleoid DNA-binding protein
MQDMSIKDRYEDISKLSGLSEEVVKRLFKATRESIAKSLKSGSNATIPGICTITPDVRTKIDTNKCERVKFINLKVRPSSALESEMRKTTGFTDKREAELRLEEQESNLGILNIVNTSLSNKNNEMGVRLNQISALL